MRGWDVSREQHVYYLGWHRSPAQVGCMRQVLGPGALGRPRGIGWRGRWEGGSGWGIDVTPWLIHVNVWQNPLQCCEVISHQLIKINEKKKKESACNSGDPGSLPGSGGSLTKGNGNPLQPSCLENSIDRGAWWARVHGATKSRTCLRTNTPIFPWPWELWIPNFPWPQWSGPFFLSFLYISSTLLVTLSISEHFLWSWAARRLRTSAENSSQLKPSADRHWQCCLCWTVSQPLHLQALKAHLRHAFGL